ncbi:MAG: CvpA family protein [candidate division KSB1 bacterium]|nr:CvpA family protein [candidate division KSB1 bacterium]
MSNAQIYIYIDLFLVFIVILFGYKGYRKRFFSEFVSFLGFMAALAGGLMALPLLAPKIVTATKLTFGASLATAFLLGFAFIWVAYRYVEKFIYKHAEFKMTEKLDHTFGVIIGVVKGLFVASLLAIFLKSVYISGELTEQVNNSNFVPFAESVGPAMYDRMRKFIPGARSFVAYLEDAAEKTPPQLVDNAVINVLIDLNSSKAEQWTNSKAKK